MANTGKKGRFGWVSTASAAVALLGLGLVGLRPAYSDNSATMSISITIRCEGGMAAVIPRTDYVITLGQGTPTMPMQGCSSELSVTGDINVDGRIESRCSRDREGLRIYHKTPAMKLTGMLCQPRAHAELQVTNTSAEGAGEVAIQAPEQSPKSASFLAKEEARPLYGNGGAIREDGIMDGDDYDRFRNGEIVFGGASSQTGGSVTIVSIPQRALDGDSNLLPNVVFAFSAR